MSLQKDIGELINAEVISKETANKIREYYAAKSKNSGNRLFMIFGVLGAILVGLGIISIIAHNWDQLSRTVKTVLAFLPLITGQLIGAFTLFKKSENRTWAEASAVFIFFAVGASMAMVSQVYNIDGDLSSFLLTWMLLCFPLMYVFKSSMVSLLYLCGINYYVCQHHYWSFNNPTSYIFWGLLAIELPFYFFLLKKRASSNFSSFHHWLIPLSIIIPLATLTDSAEFLTLIAYMSFFGLLYMIGCLDFFRQGKIRNNGYLVLGSTGTISLLMALSYEWFWEDLIEYDHIFENLLFSTGFLITILFTLSALILLANGWRKKKIKDVKPIEFVFILFPIIYIIGSYSLVAIWLVNLLILGIGILTIREGAKLNHLGILNYGLMIITILIINRYFDSNLSFVFRGVLFILVGAGFFVTNSWMLKKRKKNG